MSKSAINIQLVWCRKCQALKLKDKPHKCSEPRPAMRLKAPCQGHVYPPGSSRCRGCGHIAGD